MSRSNPPIETEGSQLCSQHATNSWRNLWTLDSSDWDLAIRGSTEDLTKRSCFFSGLRHTSPIIPTIEMLETELRKVREHRDVVVKKWSNSEAEVEEAKKQHQTDQQRIKELEDSLKSLQADLAKKQLDHDQKLKELEVETKERVNNIGRRTIYQIWSFNPELDFGFLGDKGEDMLAFCEKTRKEDLGEEEETEAEEEGPTKSPMLM
uniref:Uncharacterized protein n=1 Tax=Cannabis sativa TaxID=3483 RepID=A0A803PSG7_CANSA